MDEINKLYDEIQKKYGYIRLNNIRKYKGDIFSVTRARLTISHELFNKFSPQQKKRLMDMFDYITDPATGYSLITVLEHSLTWPIPINVMNTKIR